MNRRTTLPFSHGRLALLALGGLIVVMLAAPGFSQASMTGLGVPTASVEGECMIEPWECEPEAPEPPEPCDGGLSGYIVVFQDWVADPSALAHEQVEKYGGHLGFVYQYAPKGYSAEYPPSVIEALRGERSVKYVEPDGIVEIAGTGAGGGAQSSPEGGCELEGPEPPEGECMIEPWECEPEAPEPPEPCDGGLSGYIVVFQDWVADPSALAHEQVEKYGGHLGFVYQYAPKGYSAEYPPSVIEALRGEPSVKYVEPDGIVEAFAAEPGDVCAAPGPDSAIGGSAATVGSPAPVPAGGTGGGGRASDLASLGSKRRVCRKRKARRRGICRHATARQSCASRGAARPRECMHRRAAG